MRQLVARACVSVDSCQLSADGGIYVAEKGTIEIEKALPAQPEGPLRFCDLPRRKVASGGSWKLEQEVAQRGALPPRHMRGARWIRQLKSKS